MTGVCPIPGTGAGFLRGVLVFIDCQTQVIAGEGYRALAAPGSNVGVFVGSLIAIFVTIYGFRLLAGRVPDGMEIALAALKIGLVLMLATSWDAYRVLVYDVVLRGPAEIIELANPTSSVGSAGHLDRLQSGDDAILALTKVGTGRVDAAASQASDDEIGTRPQTPFGDELAFSLARISYLVGTIATLGLVRLLAGILLALGPLFAGLLLFENTLPLFTGWLRLLCACLFATIAIAFLFEVELSILLPWANNVLQLRAAQLATPAAPLELMVITSTFALIIFGSLAFMLRLTTMLPAIAASVRLSMSGRHGLEGALLIRGSGTTTTSAPMSNGYNVSGPPLDIGQAGSEESPSRIWQGHRVGGSIASDRGTASVAQAVPLGHSYRRSSGLRVRAASQSRPQR